MFYRLIRTDLKRISHYGTYMLVAAVVMISLFSTLALKAVSYIYSDPDRSPMCIGIIMNADSNMSQMAYAAIKDMDSYRSSCTFEEISDKETAMSKLSDGSIFAAVYVPDNIISDIMDGTNTPVEVYYSDSHSIDSFVLNDLFQSTSSMLGISQAAIYSVQAIGRDMALPDDIQQNLSDDINTTFLKRVLDRASVFVTNEINATRASDTTDFYMSASVIFLMMLCGVIFIPFILNTPASYRMQLRAHGIDSTLRYISSFVSIYVWEYLLYISVYISLCIAAAFTGKLHIHLSVYGILFGCVITAFVTLLTLIVSMIPAGITGCILLLTVVSIVLAYLSGFFIPEALLPNFAKDFCHNSILNHLAQTLCSYIS